MSLVAPTSAQQQPQLPINTVSTSTSPTLKPTQSINIGTPATFTSWTVFEPMIGIAALLIISLLIRTYLVYLRRRHVRSIIGSRPDEPDWFVFPSVATTTTTNKRSWRRAPDTPYEDSGNIWFRRGRTEAAMDAWQDVAAEAAAASNADPDTMEESVDTPPQQSQQRRHSLSSLHDYAHANQPRLLVHPDVPPPSQFIPPRDPDYDADEIVAFVYGTPGSVVVHGGGTSAAFLGTTAFARHERSVVSDLPARNTGGLLTLSPNRPIREGKTVKLLGYFETLVAVLGQGRTASELAAIASLGEGDEAGDGDQEWRREVLRYEAGIDGTMGSGAATVAGRRSAEGVLETAAAGEQAGQGPPVEPAIVPQPSEPTIPRINEVPTEDPPAYDAPPITAPTPEPHEQQPARELQPNPTTDLSSTLTRPRNNTTTRRSQTSPAAFDTTIAYGPQRRTQTQQRRLDPLESIDPYEPPDLVPRALRRQETTHAGLFQAPMAEREHGGTGTGADENGETSNNKLQLPKVMVSLGYVPRPYPGFLVPGRFSSGFAVLIWSGTLILSIPDREQLHQYKFKRWKNRGGNVVVMDTKFSVKEGDVVGVGMVRVGEQRLGALVTVNGKLVKPAGLGGEEEIRPGNKEEDIELGSSVGVDLWDAVVMIPANPLVDGRAEELLYPGLGSRGASQLLANFTGPFLWDGAGFGNGVGVGGGAEEETRVPTRDEVDPPPEYLVV